MGGRSVADEVALARAELIEALGQQSAFWGVGKVTGALYAVLYLSPRPLTLAEVAAALGTSKGNVSTSIRTLEHLGMVHRSVRPADRHVYFEPETDFWDIARRVLSRRHKPEFDRSFDLVAQSLGRARAAPAGDEQRFVTNRLDALKAFYDDLDGIVALVLALDPRRLAGVLRMAARARAGPRPGRRGDAT